MGSAIWGRDSGRETWRLGETQFFSERIKEAGNSIVRGGFSKLWLWGGRVPQPAALVQSSDLPNKEQPEKCARSAHFNDFEINVWEFFLLKKKTYSM